MNVIFLVSTLLFFRQAECVKKCYSCNDDCTDVKEATCASLDDFMCQASSRIIAGKRVYSRKCVPKTKNNENECKKINSEKESHCYNCYEDECNSQAEKPPASDENELVKQLTELIKSLGVNKCYVCEGQCEKPEIKTCEMDFLCIDKTVTYQNGTTTTSRNCVTNTEELKKACTYINTFSNTTCSVCHEDLCNNKSPKDSRAGIANAAETYFASATLLTILVSLLLTKF